VLALGLLLIWIGWQFGLEGETGMVVAAEQPRALVPGPEFLVQGKDAAEGDGARAGEGDGEVVADGDEGATDAAAGPTALSPSPATPGEEQARLSQKERLAVAPSTPHDRERVAAFEPTVRAKGLPEGGLFVRATGADGAAAVGAPIGLWVAGGRTLLSSAVVDADGVAWLEETRAVAARYEVGLVAPGAGRVTWPPRHDRRGPLDDEVGLARALPLALALPACGAVEVRVVDAATNGSQVELGLPGEASFRGLCSAVSGADGVARFEWIPVGGTLAVRVVYPRGASQAVVEAAADLDEAAHVGVGEKVEARRVTVHPPSAN